MNQSFLRPAVGLVIASLLATFPIAAQEYKRLADIITDIRGMATGSGGSATASELKNSAGAVIMTEGANLQTSIWLLTINKGGAARMKILVTGTQHAREWVAYRAALTAAEFILANRNNESWPAGARFDHFRKFKEMNVKGLTDNAAIYLIPIVNPEGYYYSKEVTRDDMTVPATGGWRKNRRNNAGDPKEANEPAPRPGMPFVGVDLNRNFPGSDWGTRTLAPAGWETTSRWRWEDVYCGIPNGRSWAGAIRPPIHERETDSVVILSSSNAFDCHIDIHSFGGTVGWAERSDAAGQNLRPGGGLSDRRVFQALGAMAASLIADPGGGNYSPEESPYPTSGDTLFWQYEKTRKKCLTFLIEIGRAQNFRPANATAHADAVLPGQIFMMFCAVDKGFAAKPDAKFKKPQP